MVVGSGSVMVMVTVLRYKSLANIPVVKACDNVPQIFAVKESKS